MIRDILLLATIFTIIDALWIGVIANPFYKRHIGDLLRTTPRWTPAVLFYGIYLAGLYLLALRPGLQAANISTAVLHAGALGFLAYATYDLTNLSTLKGWSVRVTIIDMAWGTVLSTSSVALTYLIVSGR